MTGDKLQNGIGSPEEEQTHQEGESSVNQSSPGRIEHRWLVLRSVLSLVLGTFLVYTIYFYFIFLHSSASIAYLPRLAVNAVLFALVVLPFLGYLLNDVKRAFTRGEMPALSRSWIGVSMLATLACVAYVGVAIYVSPSYIFVYYPTTDSDIRPTVTVGRVGLEAFSVYGFNSRRFQTPKTNVGLADTVTATTTKGILARVVRPKRDGEPLVPFHRHTQIDLQRFLDLNVLVTVIDEEEVTGVGGREAEDPRTGPMNKWWPELMKPILRMITKPVSKVVRNRKDLLPLRSSPIEGGPVVIAERKVGPLELDPNIGLGEQCEGKMQTPFRDRQNCVAVLLSASEGIVIDIGDVERKVSGTFYHKAECVHEYSYEYTINAGEQMEGGTVIELELRRSRGEGCEAVG